MNKLIKKIKLELNKKNCDYYYIVDCIEKIEDKETFRQLKEQKIINKIMDKGEIDIISNAYLNCWISLSKWDFDLENYFKELSVESDNDEKKIDFNEENAYLDFVIITSAIKKCAIEKINKITSAIKSYNKINCISSVLCWMNYQVEDIIRNAEVKYDNEVTRNSKLKNDDVFYTKFIHELSGKVKDFLYPGTRIMTTLLNNLDESEFNVDTMLTNEQIKDLYNFHAIYETNQYLIDKVAYGEFKVKSVDFYKYECRLDYTNSQLVKVRYSQIRNDILFDYKNKDSIVKYMFQEFAVNFIVYYYEYCSNELKFKFKKSIQEIICELKFELSIFTPDDDLILSYFSNKINVLKMYLFAVSLLSVSIVNKNIAYMNSPSIMCRELFYVPLDFIDDYINESFGFALDWETIKYFVVTDKIKNSRDILKKPFIMTKQGNILGVLCYTNFDYWIDNIRNNLICGDKISNKIGNEWEMMLESIFTEFKWNILGRGIVLKKNGKTVTDIDLLVIKDGIMIIVQSKGIGGCDFPYEFWKAQNTIENGIEQALISKKFLQENKEFLIDILSRNKINYNDVKEIHAIVVTPNLKFSGWNDKGVAVICINDLLKILNETDITQEVILKIIEWFNDSKLISKDEGIISIKANIGGFDFYIPDVN